VFELQHADDAAIPSHEPTDLQDNLGTLAHIYQKAGLTINTKKTEIIASGPDSSSSQPSFTVSGDTLSTTQQFTCLGSILTSCCDLINEIQQRIILAFQLSVNSLAVRFSITI